jgi:hypothetical protein
MCIMVRFALALPLSSETNPTNENHTTEYQIGNNIAYKLQLVEASQVRPVFHVSHVKKFHTLVFSDFSQLLTLDTVDMSTETALDRRPVIKVALLLL